MSYDSLSFAITELYIGLYMPLIHVLSIYNIIFVQRVELRPALPRTDKYPLLGVLLYIYHCSSCHTVMYTAELGALQRNLQAVVTDAYVCISVITDAYVYKHKMDAGMGPS